MNTPGVYLKPANVTAASADVSITTNMRNDAGTPQTLTVVSDIVDAAGNLVSELTTAQSVAAGANVNFVQNTTIANPHRWNGVLDPYLYTVYVTVTDGVNVHDLVQQHMGLRTFSVDPNAGAMLNGQYYDLHGVNFHQDRLNKGWAISDGDQVEDVNLIQEMGSTFVRLSHYQHPQLTYDLLDQRGIAAWSEIPHQRDRDTAVSNTTAFLDNAKQQLQEMIRQNYNHPAVLVWGLFNEIARYFGQPRGGHGAEQPGAQEDPTRPRSAPPTRVPSGQLNTIPDIAWLQPLLRLVQRHVRPDRRADRSTSTRRIPTRPFGISEYGAGAGITQHQDNPSTPDPVGLFHPEEYQSLFHEAYWIALKTRPFVWEKTIWNMFDFAADGRNEGDTPGRNDKGMVTYDRQTRRTSSTSTRPTGRPTRCCTSPAGATPSARPAPSR